MQCKLTKLKVSGVRVAPAGLMKYRVRFLSLAGALLVCIITAFVIHLLTRSGNDDGVGGQEQNRSRRSERDSSHRNNILAIKIY